MDFAELFTSPAKRIQVFFTDFFGIGKTYNTPGTSGDQNWSLRLPNNFEEHETIDLAAILKAAIIARGKDFAKKQKEEKGYRLFLPRQEYAGRYRRTRGDARSTRIHAGVPCLPAQETGRWHGGSAAHQPRRTQCLPERRSAL